MAVWQAMAERDQQHAVSPEEPEERRQVVQSTRRYNSGCGKRWLKGISNMRRHLKSSAEQKQGATQYRSCCCKRWL